jgi:hypothetical protein
MLTRKYLLLFRISWGIFLLLTLLLSGCTNDISWQSGNSNLRPLIQQAVQENTKVSLDLIWQGKVAKIKKNLFLIDYNSEVVCGDYGCLYSLYQVFTEERKGLMKIAYQTFSPQFKPQNTNYQHLWSAYFQPYYPPGKPLFTVIEDGREYPCLQFHQIQAENYQDLTYCYDGETYNLKDFRSFLKSQS